MIEIHFHKPRINDSNPIKLIITYPFSILIYTLTSVYNGQPYYREISLNIDCITKNIWNYNQSDLEKVLFKFLLDSDKINIHNLQNLLEGKIDEFILPTYTERVYDPDKLDEPGGYIIKFENELARNK